MCIFSSFDEQNRQNDLFFQENINQPSDTVPPSLPSQAENSTVPKLVPGWRDKTQSFWSASSGCSQTRLPSQHPKAQTLSPPASSLQPGRILQLSHYHLSGSNTSPLCNTSWELKSHAQVSFKVKKAHRAADEMTQEFSHCGTAKRWGQRAGSDWCACLSGCHCCRCHQLYTSGK